jgi:hypothetical protein
MFDSFNDEMIYVTDIIDVTQGVHHVMVDPITVT